MLSRYKEWVKRHPSVVQNLDWLLLFTVWNPKRTNGGFEFTYEAYHAAVGLLSLWHQNILEEGELPTSRPSPYVWLDAIEHLETLIELRGMHLEHVGKMSRYGPLLGVEAVKAVLKMAAWSCYSGHMFLRHPSPDDLHQFESEQGLQDILASLERLRCKYTPQLLASSPPVCFTTPQLQLTAAAGCAGGVDVTGQGAPEAGRGASPAAVAAAPASPPAASAGPGCCAAAGGSGSGGCGGGEVYGLREYVGEWARTLVPSRLRRRGGCGGGGGGRCVPLCADTGEQEHQQQQQHHHQHHRVSSGGGCSSSLHCGAASPPAAVTERAGCQASEWKQQRQQQQQHHLHQHHQHQHHQWLETKQQWQQQQQEAAGVGGMGLGLRLGAERRGGGGRGAGGGGEDADAHMGRNLLWLSELLHIWRPVVYVTLLKRYGRRSWRPWTTSLVVDLLSGHFHRRGRQHLATAAARAAAAAVAAAGGGGGGDFGGGDGVKDAPTASLLHGRGTSLLSLALARSLAAPGITAGEERELYDRRRKLALYALRSPFLEATTLSWLGVLRDATRNVPLLGFGADYLYGLVDTFTAYYCYTSGSN